MMDFSKSKFDFVGKAKLWYTISIIVIAIGFIGMGKNLVTEHFPLVRGIDFSGGSIIQLQFDNWDQSRDTAQFSAEIERIIADYAVKTPQVQTTVLTPEENGTENYGLLVQIRAGTHLIDAATVESRAEMDSRLEELGGLFMVVEETEVGAVVGKELTNKAIQGVIIGLVLILIYITIRLSFDFAVFAIVALVHDILILLGIYALFGFEINSPFVAVILTVVGYSINDTIIIYDRIRENMKVKRHLPFDQIVNVSLLETMARSINTAGTTLLAILAILIFGGESLRTFMIGLGIGITAGTYSSIFIASMLLVTWRMKGKKLAIETAAPRTSAVGLITSADDYSETDDEEDEEEIEQVEPIKIGSVSEGPRRPKQKPKRRRRRN